MSYDKSAPTYPHDSFRTFIKKKIHENGKKIVSPFFCLEFLYRYKELFSFIIQRDLEFKNSINVKNFLENNKINNASKDDLSVLIFQYYVEKPSEIFKLIKHFRKNQKTKKLILVEDLIKDQLPIVADKKKKDTQNRILRLSNRQIHEQIEQKKKQIEENKKLKLKQEFDKNILKIENEKVSLLKMASNFTTAMKDFASSGFLRVTPEQYSDRMKICNGCEFWQADARMGMGKCLKCGCTGAKQWIATSECPIQKWGKISKEEVEASRSQENVKTEETQGSISQQTDGSAQEPSTSKEG